MAAPGVLGAGPSPEGGVPPQVGWPGVQPGAHSSVLGQTLGNSAAIGGDKAKVKAEVGVQVWDTAGDRMKS